jgi:hypothetical protein
LYKEVFECSPQNVGAASLPRATPCLDYFKMLQYIPPLVLPGAYIAELQVDTDAGGDSYA